MMEIGRRFVLLSAVVVLLSIPVMKTGRGPSVNDGSAAFLPYTTGTVIVKVGGEVRSRGSYAFHEGAGIDSVINMTLTGHSGRTGRVTVSPVRLGNGDVVELIGGAVQRPEIQMKSMKARERMLLGIPLHPDRMDYDDWRALPGIGPVLAKRIVIDRQNNGDYGSLEGVKRVSGIGEATCDKLKKYF